MVKYWISGLFQCASGSYYCGVDGFTMVVPFIDHITSSRQVDMKEEAIGRIISGFDDQFSYWFFVSPSIMKSICYAYPLISKGITLLLSRL